MKRQRIEYRIGNEHNPGNPFGRSHLTIEPDGQMRHELFTVGPAFAWTAVVLPDVLERFWRAVEEAEFPDCPNVMPPAGATLRHLEIGGESIMLPYHESVAGYDEAFSILDAILRQTSDDKVKDAGAASSAFVRDVAPAAAPEKREPAPVQVRYSTADGEGGLTPGTAFLLAYLPARRLAHDAKLAHLATLDDPALAKARMFASGALKIETSSVEEVAARHAALVRHNAVDLANVSPSLVTRAAKEAWRAGESARAVTIAAELAAHVAYLRASAPENATLRAQADEHDRVLREKVEELSIALSDTWRPLGHAHRNDAARMVELTGDTFAERSSLVSDLRTFFMAMRELLDVEPPNSFMVIDTKAVIRSSPSGWAELEPRVFAAARPELQPILERALGLRREESRRVLETERPPSFLAVYAGEPPGVLLAATKRRSQVAADVRARAMAAEDAYERLAPKSWLDDERRWFVTDQLPPKTKQDEPVLRVPWASWVLRRRPSSIDILTTICADPKNAVLAEDYAFEACRFMAGWGWRTPRRVIWMAEPEPRFHDYKGARPFRERADTERKQIVQLEIPAEARAHHAQRDLYDEGKLRAKLDLMRAASGKKLFEPIVEIWKLGYALAAVTDFGVVLLANAPKLEELLEPLAT